MLARKPVSRMMLLLAGAFCAGCAQWQHDSDRFAASAWDRPLFARIASALGEQAPAADSPASGSRGPKTVQVASLREPAGRSARRRDESPIRQAVAAEPLDMAPPTSDADPIETAPSALPKDSDSAAAAPGKAVERAAACDDVCCHAELDGPLDGPCPILGACGGCPACLAGRRCAKLFTRPEPGPPPIRHRPAMPPKFLPVPTQPVLSPARPDAPDPRRGNIEFGWGPEIMFPGDD